MNGSWIEMETVHASGSGTFIGRLSGSDAVKGTRTGTGAEAGTGVVVIPTNGLFEMKTVERI